MKVCRFAEVGEIFYINDSRLSRALLGTDDGGCCEVFPKTPLETSSGVDSSQRYASGEWICISCCKAFVNNFDKDSHCGERAARKSALVGSSDLPKAKHVLAWRSYVTRRVEVP